MIGGLGGDVNRGIPGSAQVLGSPIKPMKAQDFLLAAGLWRFGGELLPEDSRPARPRDRAANSISVLSSRPMLEPLLDMGLDLGLGRQRIFPSQLLSQHRLRELEERQSGLEAFGDQPLFFRIHGSSLPFLEWLQETSGSVPAAGTICAVALSRRSAALSQRSTTLVQSTTALSRSSATLGQCTAALSQSSAALSQSSTALSRSSTALG